MPALTEFMNAMVPEHGRVFMRDPAAFSRDGYISDKIEVHAVAADDEADARAIVRAVIEQLPSARGVLKVL